VKNSWGTSWGQQGYIWIERFSGMNPGICGMSLEPGYPWGQQPTPTEQYGESFMNI